jgi:very-short-patch-repair endonuclease
MRNFINFKKLLGKLNCAFKLICFQMVTKKSAKIVLKQRINPVKLDRAKEFRRNMTPEEKILWECLRGNKLNGLHFRRQQVIEGYIVDFYCHTARLDVEVDGKIHKR